MWLIYLDALSDADNAQPYRLRIEIQARDGLLRFETGKWSPWLASYQPRHFSQALSLSPAPEASE